MPIPPKSDPAKNCKACGTPLMRKRYGGRLEDRTRFLKREHCDQACANTRPAIQANSHRRHARKLVPLSECEKCGTSSRLHVHHKDRNPANNAMSNLQVLCASCHLKLHWAEDRAARVKAIRDGARMNKQFGGGSASLAAKRRLLPKLEDAGSQG